MAHECKLLDLTPREVTIVRMTADGYSAKESALALEIAPRTVEKHIDRLKLKLRAKNAAHLVALAAASGLLTRDTAAEATR